MSEWLDRGTVPTLIDEEREAVEVEDDISRKEELSDEDGNYSINSSSINS